MARFSIFKHINAKILAVFILGIGSLAQGQIVLTFQENGNDLDLITSGTFQIGGGLFGGFSSPVNQMYNASGSEQRIQNYGNANYRFFAGTSLVNFSSLPLQSNTGGFVQASSVPIQGNFGFRYQSNGSFTIYGPQTITANVTQVTGTMRFANSDLSTFGLDSNPSGSFTLTTSSGTQEILWNAVSAVPEPSTYAAIAFGVLGLGMFVRRRLQH
ncbi:MAG: PEP-CTERM sorting domain-containing protein [Puniceicoccaceae bacterium]